MTTVMTYTSLNSDIQEYLDRDDAELISQIPNFVTLGELRCAREVKNLGTKTSVVALFQPGKSVYLKPNRWLETTSINFGNTPGFSTVARQSSGGTRKLTFGVPHSFAVGSSISIFNMGNSTYNGTYVVTAITQYTVSYVTGTFSEVLTADTGGTVVPPLNARTAIVPRSVEYCNYFWPDRTQQGIPRFYSDYDYGNFLIVPTPKIAFPFEINMYAQPEFLSTTNQTNWWTQYARDLILYACLLESAPYLKNDDRVQTWQDRYDRAKDAIATQDKERVNDASLERME